MGSVATAAATAATAARWVRTGERRLRASSQRTQVSHFDHPCRNHAVHTQGPAVQQGHVGTRGAAHAVAYKVAEVGFGRSHAGKQALQGHLRLSNHLAHLPAQPLAVGGNDPLNVLVHGALARDAVALHVKAKPPPLLRRCPALLLALLALAVAREPDAGEVEEVCARLDQQPALHRRRLRTQGNEGQMNPRVRRCVRGHDRAITLKRARRGGHARRSRGHALRAASPHPPPHARAARRWASACA